jgi:ribosomal protein S18 acetylase RimI-like enzyme
MITPQSHFRGDFEITTDPSRLDATAVHEFLANRSHWAIGRTLDVVQKSLDNSLCFGVYHQKRQIGLARVITDYATYAYMCDVYILEEYRGQGLGTWLVGCVVEHPILKELRRFSLITSDAQELYRKFGFAEVTDASRYMNLRKPGPG